MKQAISFGALIGLVIVSVFTFREVVDTKLALNQAAAVAVTTPSFTAAQLAQQETTYINLLKSAIGTANATTTNYLNTLAGINCQLRSSLGVPCSAAYTAPVFDYGNGAISHRVNVKFTNGPGKLTFVGLLPSFANCYGLGTTITNQCKAGDYAQGSTCGIYLQKQTTGTGNCIARFDYIISSATSTLTTTETKYFKSSGPANSEVISEVLALPGAYVDFVSSNHTITQGSISGDADIVNFNFTFKVIAKDTDIVLDGDTVQGIVNPNNSTDGLSWATTTNSNTGTSTYPSVLVALNGNTSNDKTTAGDQRFVVREGESRNFRFSVSIPTGKDNGVLGAVLTGVRWGVRDLITTDNDSDYQTERLFISLGPVTGLQIR